MESENLNSFKLTNVSGFFKVTAIALENDISSHKMKVGEGKSHLQIMSDIWGNKSHFWNPGDLVCQYLCQVTTPTAQARWSDKIIRVTVMSQQQRVSGHLFHPYLKITVLILKKCWCETVEELRWKITIEISSLSSL